MKNISTAELYDILNLPRSVILELDKYKEVHGLVLKKNIADGLRYRSTWDSALQELYTAIGDDCHGFGVLAELLEVCRDTYDSYRKKGIPEEIFIRTMGFVPRFLEAYKREQGHYAFIWAWWFPRQLAMLEFRIGELEFEFVDGKERKIFIHIPGDANLSPLKVEQTVEQYREFLRAYYPEWEDVKWYCESWMLSPVLNQLLQEDSNVLAFQRRFAIESVDYESMAVLDWVFPGEKCPIEDLSEHTSLQKKMKAFLLDGGKVGWAEGVWK